MIVMSKRNISYISHDEPTFIKRFKEKVGYKESASVDSKREELEREDSDAEEPEDERPTVVVLRKGDLTAEEAEQHVVTNPQGGKGEDDDDSFVGSKIMFKKPKKKDGEKSELSVSSSNKTEKNRELSKTLDKERSKVKKIQNKKLLSFDEEEEEEDG